MPQLTAKQVKKFQSVVLGAAKENRRSFPWRDTLDPYRVVVSEFMLQQTQAERVVPKYTSFIKKYPSWRALAKATLGEVLTEWQGLGYNRRAKYIRTLAQVVAKELKGRLPSEESELVKLPGIGPASAAAIRAFAFNKPSLYLETNVRSVYLHYFFRDQLNITDAELLPLLQQTMDQKNSRLWNTALLDYGAWLKKNHGNPSRRSLHYSKQSPFKGSTRYFRGQIVKILARGGWFSALELQRVLGSTKASLSPLLKLLVIEGLVHSKKGKYSL